MRRFTSRWLLWFSLLAQLISGIAYAAPAVPTDAGRVLKDNQPPGSPATPLPPAIQNPAPPRQAPTEAPSDDVRVQVSAFSFSGNTKVSEAALQTAVSQWTGKSLNFGELTQVLDSVEAIYRQAGYFLAQAVLPPQQIRDGIINIVITEGKLGRARLEGESRTKPEIVYRYLESLSPGEVITEDTLDRASLLLNDLAGGSTAIDLQAGDEPGTTDVVVVQKIEPFFTGRASVDNQGLPATGEKRLSLSASLNSPLHLGDRLSANFVGTSGNLHTYALNYELPVGGDGWRLNLGKSRAVYALGNAFSALDASGTADSWRFGASYPYIRSRSTNVDLQLAGDYSNLKDNLGAAGLRLTKQSYGLTFTPSIDWQDKLGEGGSNRVELQLRYARLNLGATALSLDVPPAGPNTDGAFGKALLTLQRSQKLPYKLGINLQWKQQLATDNLDSSEKISIGGAQNLVAYPNSQATADEGGFGKLELRWQVLDNVSVGAFVEYAHLKLLHSAIAGSTTNHAHYSDAGFAFNWTIFNRVDVAASIAWAGSQPPNPTDDDRPRVWANIGYNW